MSVLIHQGAVSGVGPSKEINFDQRHRSYPLYFQANTLTVLQQLGQKYKGFCYIQDTDIFGDLCQTVLKCEIYVVRYKKHTWLLYFTLLTS